MKFQSLNYFFEVCKDMNISKAAKRVAVSQQALSRTISELELELHATLFIRTRSGVILTQAGEYLLHQSQDVLQQLSDIRTTISTMDANREGIHIAVMHGAFSVFFNELPTSYANIPISYTEESEDNCLKKLRSGNCDLAITSYVPVLPELHVFPFFSEQYVVVMSETHPAAHVAQFDISMFQDQTIILNPNILYTQCNILDTLQQRGIYIKDYMYITSPFSAFQKCITNQCFVFLGASVMACISYPGIRFFPIPTTDFSWNFSCVTQDKQIAGRPVATLVQHLLHGL